MGVLGWVGTGVFSLMEKNATMSSIMAIGRMMKPTSNIVVAYPMRKSSHAVLNMLMFSAAPILL